MDSIEQTGRTVDEAVATACKALGVSREEVDVEVLAQESRGLLGILGYSAAKVRVTTKHPREAVPPEQPSPRSASEREELEPPEPPPVWEPREELAPEQLSDLAQRAVEILTRMLELMSMEARPKVVSDDAEAVAIELEGPEDLGLLIGKHGQTLAALQLIVAMMANRTLPLEERRRITLDAEGYRARRDHTLEGMAHSAAQRAKRTGRPVTIGSLTARERRIIHVTLAEDTSVTTRSEGEEPDRVIIVTARRTYGPPGRSSIPRRG